MGCPKLNTRDYFRFITTEENTSSVTMLKSFPEGRKSAHWRNPYGRVVKKTGSPDLPFKFQGKYYDSEFGIYNFGLRYLQSETCKWLSRDPIGERGGINLYAFGNGDPINGIEYLGCADLPNHLNIGFDVLDILRIRPNRQEMECFLSGCIYPDMPDVPLAADNGVIPKAMPLHIYLQTKEGYEYYKTKYQDQIRRISDVVSMIGDIDEFLIPQAVKKPFQYAGEKLAVPGKRFGYWWNQTSYIGPILRYTPGLKNFDTVRTHYGDMAYYHAMGYKGNSAVELRQSLINITDERIHEFRRYMTGGNTYDAYFALGQAVHYLTDSWTPSHAQRNKLGLIRRFQDYSIQDLNIHKTRDALYQYDPASYNNAVVNSSIMVFEALIGGGTFDSSWYYQTAPDVNISIPRLMEQKPLWNIMFNGY